MLANNEEFRMIHKRNLTREQNPLNKMQSIIALCGKLVRIIYVGSTEKQSLKLYYAYKMN